MTLQWLMHTPHQKRPWTRFTTLYAIVSAIQIVTSIRADDAPQIRYGGGVGAAFEVLGRPKVHFKKQVRSYPI